MSYSDPRPVDALFPAFAALRMGRACPFCAMDVRDEDFRDEVSRKESHISGMCQPCQDAFYGIPDDFDIAVYGG